MNKFLSFGAAMVGLSLIVTTAEAIAADLTFTKIADSTDGFSSFFSAPAINDAGTVAFSATLSNGSTGVFTRSGGTITPFALSGGTNPELRSIITNPGINNSGTVVFGASTNNPSNIGVFTSSGNGAISAIAGTSTNQNIVSLGGAPAISNTGTVAFAAYTRSSSGDTPGLFTSSNNQLSTTNLNRSVSGQFASNPNSVAINNAGTVVVSSSSGFGNGGVFAKATDTPLTLLREGGAGPVSINNSGSYAAGFSFTAGYTEVAIGNSSDGTLTRIIPGRVDVPLRVGSPSINDQGTVVFQARLEALADRPGQQALYFNSYTDANRIIKTGDSLFGSTVTSLGQFSEFSSRGLNNAGQVVFYAELADGRVGIFQAEPIPEPHTIIPGVLLLVGFGIRSKLRRKRRQDEKNCR